MRSPKAYMRWSQVGAALMTLGIIAGICGPRLLSLPLLLGGVILYIWANRRHDEALAHEQTRDRTLASNAKILDKSQHPDAHKGQYPN